MSGAQDQLVRVESGVPASTDFASGVGSPIVIDSTTNAPYYMDGTTVKPLAIFGVSSTGLAPSGMVGEYIESLISSGSAVSLTTNAFKDVTSISLTPGDWDIDGEVSFLGNAATNVTQFIFGSSSASASLGAQGSFGVTVFGAAGLVPFGVNSIEMAIPSFRYSISINTSIFLIALASFTLNTCTAYGLLRARRIR